VLVLPKRAPSAVMDGKTYPAVSAARRATPRQPALVTAI
jgi:hypothetical protein